MFITFLALLFFADAASANDNQQMAAAPIIGMDFANLMNLEVTSVSKREDTLSQTAAAVYVLTAEDIRRSGARSIPDLLRLVPGLDVARPTSNTWAVSSRGFNGLTANKLQVLIDGRSVYSPLFSGTFWDIQNVVLENIDRIEVIRGPGASVWGANAVNGVINIIRKPASETQGGRIAAGGGTEERAFGSAQYGGRLGSSGHYRVQTQYFDRDDTRTTTGNPANDNWHMVQGGFRADFDNSDKNIYMVSTDFYSGNEGQTSPINTLTPPFRTTHRDQTEVNGGNVMTRWTRPFSARSNLQLQFYYDRTERRIPFAFGEARDTYDLDFQNLFPLGTKHSINWGLEARVSADRVNDSFSPDFEPDDFTSELYSGFVQDEMALAHNVLFTIGTKIEHNDFTGIEIQPSARAAWRVHEKHTLWAAISRAVRSPSRFDRHVRVQAVVAPTPLTVISFRGNEGFDSEKLIAYEAGYRADMTSRLFVDLAGFYNVYDELLSVEPGTPFTETNPSPSHIVAPFYFQNKATAESYGVELAPQHQLTEWWRIQAQYTYLHLRIHLEPGSRDTQTIATEGNNPKHQFSIRSAWNLPHHFELDGVVRYVDNLRSQNVGSYTVMDVRLGWKGIRNVDLEAVGRDLLETHHREFQPGNEIERSVYGKATWHF